MKRKMDLEELKKLYGTNAVIREGNCYYRVDKETGIAFGLPAEFQVTADGKVLDPTFLLNLPCYCWDAAFYDLFEPLSVEYICGRGVVSALGKIKRVKFYPGDPLDDIKKMDTILLKARWDKRNGVYETGWAEKMETLYAKQMFWSLAVADSEYRNFGSWYWLIKIEKTALVPKLMCLVYRYVNGLKGVYEVIEGEMKKFEAEKDDYRAKIMTLLDADERMGNLKVLPSGDDMVVIEYVTWLKQHVKKEFRCDSIGLGNCEEFIKGR